MKNLALSAARRVVKTLAYGVVGGFVVLVAVIVLHLEGRPDLHVWHEAELDAEFTDGAGVESFDDYVALEKRLFEQLDVRVYARVPSEGSHVINRYQRGSLTDPGRWSPNWNRTFEFAAKAPGAGVLLLHGMSDSPYSLRSLGQRLHESGAWVVGLRLPGHGTAPSGLVRVRWEDMAAAVRLAVDHLKDKVGDRPLYIVGYSNGGALAVHYALEAIEDPTLPSVEGIALISPAIGVSGLAALAVWQARLGSILGLHKLAWNDILPEYDPFKYGSFAVNAGDQVYRITTDIQSRLKRLGAAGDLTSFPPILAFQSAVDATVSSAAVVKELFMRLPAAGHELILFDINRGIGIDPLIKNDPKTGIDAMLNDPDLPFVLSVVANRSEKSRSVVVRQKKRGDEGIIEVPLDLTWPVELYSLSHVSLPFPMNDPLYGASAGDDNPVGFGLGNIVARGERGVLHVSASAMMRLRWNPFYAYMERRLLAFIKPSSRE